MSEKKSIFVVSNTTREQAEGLLSLKYDIVKFSTIIEYVNSTYNTKKGDVEVPDIVIYGDDTPIPYNSFLEISSEIVLENEAHDEDTHFISSIYSTLNYIKSVTFLGFGNGSIALGLMNGTSLLFDVVNHNDSHLVSFCLNETDILDYEASSNHSMLHFPRGHRNYNILAFSTFNLSNSYTTTSAEIIKAKENFIEIEGIVYNDNSYCFSYNIPTTKQKILCDLTMQFID